MELQKEIIDFLSKNSASSSKEISDGIGKSWSYSTLKRALVELENEQLISKIGKGRGTKYSISEVHGIFSKVNLETYFLKEVDERIIQAGYNFKLIPELLKNTDVFNDNEIIHLTQLQGRFAERISKMSNKEYELEFERLAIDLSWKSSQIEGNTYSLLETERLLNEKQTAAGKSKDEAVMLLNHKATLDFLMEHRDFAQPLNIRKIEDLHLMLTKDLGVPTHIRNRKVGITGTKYTPLDNSHQIEEAMFELCKLINAKENIFEKAFLALVLISYIQPFVDENKRTARILSNAILINYNFCPISFRTVDSIDYKKAMLVFYEQNNVSAFKKIFIEQFEFAVDTYF